MPSRITEVHDLAGDAAYGWCIAGHCSVCSSAARSVARDGGHRDSPGTPRNVAVPRHRRIYSFGESLGPETLVALLNDYFSSVEEQVTAHGGTVMQFQGTPFWRRSMHRLTTQSTRLVRSMQRWRSCGKHKSSIRCRSTSQCAHRVKYRHRISDSRFDGPGGLYAARRCRELVRSAGSNSTRNTKLGDCIALDLGTAGRLAMVSRLGLS